MPSHALLSEASSAQPTTPRSCPSSNSPAPPPHSAGEAVCRHHGETDGLLALKYDPHALPKPIPDPVFRSLALTGRVGLHGGLRDDRPYPAPRPSAPHPRRTFSEKAWLLARRCASPVELHRIMFRSPLVRVSLEWACRLAGEVLPTAGEVPTTSRSAE